MNNYGAEKVTNYLGQYIDSNYNLKDHRGEDAYLRFERVYNNWIEELRTFEADKDNISEPVEQTD